MNQQDIILRIIQDTAGKPVHPAPDESLFESGVLDSFALPDMVQAIEKQFSIQIPDSDLNPRKFDSINRISEYLESRRS